ncbi:MAG: hypothetical protein RLY59_1360, partial [Actinomycetota bacterium]
LLALALQADVVDAAGFADVVNCRPKNDSLDIIAIAFSVFVGGVEVWNRYRSLTFLHFEFTLPGIE